MNDDARNHEREDSVLMCCKPLPQHDGMSNCTNPGVRPYKDITFLT
jgi:hypothetical protein